MIAGVVIVVMVIVIAVGIGFQHAPLPAVKSTIHDLVIHRAISAPVLGTPSSFSRSKVFEWKMLPMGASAGPITSGRTTVSPGIEVTTPPGKPSPAYLTAL